MCKQDEESVFTTQDLYSCDKLYFSGVISPHTLFVGVTKVIIIYYCDHCLYILCLLKFLINTFYEYKQ